MVVGITAFEHGDHLSPWFLVKGNVIPQFGRKGQITPDTANIRMGGCSMQLGPEAEIAQVVTDLTPDTWYEFAGFLLVDPGEKAYLGVRDHGGEETCSPSSSVFRGMMSGRKWDRSIVCFKTGPSSTSAKVFIRRATKGEGQVFADDLGLIYTQ